MSNKLLEYYIVLLLLTLSYPLKMFLKCSYSLSHHNPCCQTDDLSLNKGASKTCGHDFIPDIIFYSYLHCTTSIFPMIQE